MGQTTPQNAVEAWLKSEGHCKNIMNPAFAEIGAGLAYGTYNGIPSTPYWTLDLGKQR